MIRLLSAIWAEVRATWARPAVEPKVHGVYRSRQTGNRVRVVRVTAHEVEFEELGRSRRLRRCRAGFMSTYYPISK